MTGKSSHTKINIDKLGKEFSALNMSFGNLDIKTVSSKFETISVKASHTPINIKFEQNSSFDLDADVEFGKITLPQGNNDISFRESKYNKEEVKGRIGKGSSKKASLNRQESM